MTVCMREGERVEEDFSFSVGVPLDDVATHARGRNRALNETQEGFHCDAAPQTTAPRSKFMLGPADSVRCTVKHKALLFVCECKLCYV